MTLFNRLFDTDKWHGRFLIVLSMLSLTTASIVAVVAIFVFAPPWVGIGLVLIGVSALIAALD